MPSGQIIIWALSQPSSVRLVLIWNRVDAGATLQGIQNGIKIHKGLACAGEVTGIRALDALRINA